MIVGTKVLFKEQGKRDFFLQASLKDSDIYSGKTEVIFDVRPLVFSFMNIILNDEKVDAVQGTL